MLLPRADLHPSEIDPHFDTKLETLYGHLRPEELIAHNLGELALARIAQLQMCAHKSTSNDIDEFCDWLILYNQAQGDFTEY